MKRISAYLMILMLLLVFTPSPATSEESAYVDILHYDLNVQVSPEGHELYVVASLHLKALKDGVSSVSFLLNNGLELSSVKDGKGESLSFDRDGNDVIVFLNDPLNEGEERVIKFEYSGILKIEEKIGRYGFWGYIGPEGSYMIYESVWYPMIWGERSTAEISIRVPKGQTAISVGELREIKDDGEYSTFVWQAYIPTRGISFTAAEYKLKSTQYKHTDVKCYIFSKAPYIANKCLQISIDILDFYSSKFGEYPYSKFAVTEIPEFFSGGHGDQGFIMMDSNLFRSSLPPEFLAHEIAHNWWGALVFAEGENSLRSVKGFWNFPEAQSRTEGEEYNYWLLEGFATYSGLLYIEHEDGRKKMIDSLEDKRKEYLDKIKEYSDEPILGVEEEYGEGRYHAIVYSKGAWVLHMLRYVVGDQIYFDIMRNYARQFEGKSANIEDFQEISEGVYGRDMDWFFDQWIRGTALPDYAIGDVAVTENSGRYSIKASILQRGDMTQMPVDITLHTKGLEVTKRVWIDEPVESVTFTAYAQPGYLEIDQDYWILESNKFNNIYFFEYSPTLKTLKSIILRLKRILYLF